MGGGGGTSAPLAPPGMSMDVNFLLRWCLWFTPWQDNQSALTAKYSYHALNASIPGAIICGIDAF